jgi:uncharacterized OB-fold protein
MAGRGIVTTLDAFVRAGTASLGGADDPDLAEFRRLGRDGVLRFQECLRCGYRRFPPAPSCPECLSTEYEWCEDAGVGTVWSHCTYFRAFSPSFLELVPYDVCLVELDSGPRLVTNVVNADAGTVRIGMRGRAVPTPAGEGSLVYFHLEDTEPA